MFLSMHTMDGDPDALLAAKRNHTDPVVARVAAWVWRNRIGDGATRHWVADYNIWRDAAGAEFAQEPEALQAQRRLGLPPPVPFVRHVDTEVALYSDELGG
jgi:hypothetical protein